LTASGIGYIVNPMVKHSTKLDDVFGALSDPTRRQIVERLTRGDLTAGAIASHFPVSLPAISRHLKVLERCGLMRRTIVGREHHCRLNPRAMRSAADWLEAQERFWNARFDTLDELLSRTSDKESR
jgi:DNA-binding transcriptional ArsR family regulator